MCRWKKKERDDTLVSLEQDILGPSLPRPFRDTCDFVLSCTSRRVEPTSDDDGIQIRMDERGEVIVRKTTPLPNPAPRATRSHIIFYDEIVSCPLYRFTYNSLHSPLIESLLADIAPGSYISYISYVDIEHPARSWSEDSSLSLSHYQRRLGRSTSALRLLDLPLFFLIKFFITLPLFLFSFHCFQSRIPCPSDDQSLLRTSRSCISTSLAFLRPAGILLPALLPSGQPRSFYPFCNPPTIFFFLLP